MTFIARTEGEPEAVLPQIREVVRANDSPWRWAPSGRRLLKAE